MNPLAALALLALLGTPPETTELFTPSGAVFGAFEAAPLPAGPGGGKGMRLGYAAASRDPARLARDAEALVAAVGPELAAGEVTFIAVRAAGRSGAYELTFSRDGAGWRRDAPSAEARRALGSLAPARAAAGAAAGTRRTAEAAAAAKRWVELLDDGREEAAVFETAPAFKAEIEATQQWRTLMAERRRLGAPTSRAERYRTQRRDEGGAWVIAVTFEARSSAGALFLERLALVEAAGGWKVGGYGIRHVPGT